MTNSVGTKWPFLISSLMIKVGLNYLSANWSLMLYNQNYRTRKFVLIKAKYKVVRYHKIGNNFQKK